jgi:hypothetical protein
LALEYAQVQGFKHSGVALWNCSGAGESERVVLRRLRVTASAGADAALSFGVPSAADSSPANRDILVCDSRFEGPFKAAVRVAGSLLRVEFRGNRFFRTADGLSFDKAGGAPQVQLTLESNTFAEVRQAALHFQEMPSTTPKSQVAVVNNLFALTSMLVRIDGKEQAGEAPLLFAAAGNVRGPEVKEGDYPLQATVLNFTLPTDPQNDATFLRYPRSEPMVHAGVHQRPVGVPQPE